MKGKVCGALGSPGALLLFAIVSIFCKVIGEVEGPSFYKLQVEKARLQQQRQPGKYVIANAARDPFTKRAMAFKKEKPENDEDPLKRQEYTEKADEEEEFILIEKLWHRDHISSPWRVEGLSAQERALAMRKRGKARLQAIRARRQFAASRGNESEFGQVLDPNGNIRVRLLNGGTAEYFVGMYVGSQTSPNSFLVDTASDLTWLQCEPCNGCYHQTAITQIYNPAQSSSINYLYCRTSLCMDAYFFKGCNYADQCVFGIDFMDNSHTKGLIAEETFIMGGTHIHGVYFGCSHETGGYFSPLGTGILGVGASRFSLPSQINRNLYFCLPPTEPPTVQGFLGLEPTSSVPTIPANTIYTDMIINPLFDNLYYIKMTGISINGVLLPIPDSTFAIKPDGSGGTIIDSGTLNTELTQEVFDTFRSTFRTAAVNLMEWQGQVDNPLVDLCYRMMVPPNNTNTPLVHLHFSDTAFISVPPENVLVIDDAPNKYCLAFDPAPPAVVENVIGSIQLTGFLVYFNRAASTIGFTAAQCNA